MNEFFIQLQKFSERYFDLIGVEERYTVWGPRSYSGGYPRGAVIHYTADDDLERVIKWFMRERYGARAAANVVVADRKYPSVEPLLEDLPLVKGLPVTVVQCALPNKPTWHATWASYETYGIEALNVGEVRPANGGFVSHWRRDHDPDEPEWTMPWNHPTKEAAIGWRRFWEPYTTGQIVAIINILRHLQEMYTELEPSWVVGHECVQSVHTLGAHTDKRDPGPLMPLRDIRNAVFGGFTLLDVIERYEQPGYCDAQRDRLVREWCAIEAGVAEMPTAEIAWLRFLSRMRNLVQDPTTKFSPTGLLALELLGYHVANRTHMGDPEKASVRLFQRMAGLKTDAVPGPVTRTALEARLYDRGILYD